MKTENHIKNIRSVLRPVLFLLAIMLCEAMASADVLKVKKIEHDPLDTDAAFNPRKDLNGNACALLKIVLPKEANNIIFEGNTIDIENDGVEVLVYLPQGTKYLKIKSAGFEPLEINFGESDLKGQQTYKVEIVKMKTLSQVKRSANGTALAYSIIPGLGLIQKGHIGEGVTYLIGDVALLGAGIVFSSNASSQKKILNDVNTGIDEYNKAKSKYDSSKSASYICFGVAGAVYVVNLIRSYVATPKPNSRINWNVTPVVANINNSYNSGLGISLAMTYTF